jgi:uncharacterized protein (UPF0261 family)
MSKQIVILCSMDSKGEEAYYLKNNIEACEGNVLLMDIGIGREPDLEPDITAEAVAKAGDGDIHAIRKSRETGEVTPIMIKGAGRIALDLWKEGKLAGIISFGGASNTATATTIMKMLPFGIPKLMVSSTASMPAYASTYIGTKDITMMHSVVDISGLNHLTKSVLENAAGGITGMVKISRGAPAPDGDIPLIAITSFKFSENLSHNVKLLLEKKGFAVIPFHAQGMGDRAMEELIEEGLFAGIIDVVPAGVSEQLLGGNRDAGEKRLEAAGRMGIPQVYTPCGFDMLSCGPLSRRDQDDPLWERLGLAKRKIFIPDEFRVQVRTSSDELKQIAQVVAEKLNRSRGPVKFFIPLKGWSSLSIEGSSLYDPQTDTVFNQSLRDHFETNLEIIEQDVTYDSPEFAEALVNALEEMLVRG